jgi:hypothetical protein
MPMFRPASPFVLAALATGAAALLAPATAAAQRMTMADVVKVAPENGMPAVGKWKPTWCDAVGDDGTGGGFRSLVRHTEGRYLWDSFAQAAERTCTDPDNEAFQAQVGMYMQRWVNDTGASAKQIAEFITLRVDKDKWEAQNKATCEKLPPIEEGSDRLKTLRRYELRVLGCSTFGDPTTPRHLAVEGVSADADLWTFDRGEQPESQVLAIGRLINCFGYDKIGPHQLAGWAVCRLEVPQLDQGKLEAELKAAGHNDFARIIASQAMAYVKMRGREYEAAAQAAMGKDPDVKVLFDAAEAGWKQWQADYAAARPAMDAAMAYEEKFYGLRKSAAKGCFAGLGGLLKGVMAGRKGASIEEVMTIATSGVGPVMLEHLTACMSADLPPGVGGEAVPIYMLKEMLAWGPPARGPRVAAQVALSKAAATIAADRTGFAYGNDVASVDARSPLAGRTFARTMPRIDQSGEVASLKVEGDKVKVTFKPVKFKDKEMSCTETSKIIMWSGDGTPIYARNCRYTGRTVVRDLTAQPFWTYKHFAGGIKKGVVVKYFSGVYEEGYPVEVWSKDGKTLLAVMGLEAK